MGWLPARDHAADTEPHRFGWHTFDRRCRAIGEPAGCAEGKGKGGTQACGSAGRRRRVAVLWLTVGPGARTGRRRVDEHRRADRHERANRWIAGAEQVEPSCLAAGKRLAGLRTWTIRGCFGCARHGQGRGPGNAVRRRSAVPSAVRVGRFPAENGAREGRTWFSGHGGCGAGEIPNGFPGRSYQFLITTIHGARPISRRTARVGWAGVCH